MILDHDGLTGVYYEALHSDTYLLCLVCVRHFVVLVIAFMLQPFDYMVLLLIIVFPIFIYTILVMRTGLNGFCRRVRATLWQRFACWPLAFLLFWAVF